MVKVERNHDSVGIYQKAMRLYAEPILDTLEEQFYVDAVQKENVLAQLTELFRTDRSEPIFDSTPFTCPFNPTQDITLALYNAKYQKVGQIDLRIHDRYSGVNGVTSRVYDTEVTIEGPKSQGAFLRNVASKIEGIINIKRKFLSSQKREFYFAPLEEPRIVLN